MSERELISRFLHVINGAYLSCSRHRGVIIINFCVVSGVGKIGATMQGFKATILNTAPVIWPLTENGYEFDKSALKPMTDEFCRKDIPVVTMDKLS
jgi:hypothetical protein